MRKISFILAGIVLLCSCEKIDSHYTYEEVVPGTTIKENQLGKMISHQEFVNVTNDAYYAHLGSYPCVMDKGKVYYSHEEKGDNPHYSGTWKVVRWKFCADYVESLEWFFGGNNDSHLYYQDYSFDANVLSGIVLDEIVDSKEYRVLYVDKDYLIFETDGKTDNGYNNEGSEFSRVIYKSTEAGISDLYVPQDTIDLRKLL